MQRVNSSSAAGGTSCSYWPNSPEAYYLFKLMTSGSTIKTPQETCGWSIEFDSSSLCMSGKILAGEMLLLAEMLTFFVQETKTEVDHFSLADNQLAPEHIIQWKWQKCCRGPANAIDKYTVDSHKDTNGKINLQYSLQAITLI